jgi:hypothetical protein
MKNTTLMATDMQANVLIVALIVVAEILMMRKCVTIAVSGL